MNQKSIGYRILYFPLTKIIIGFLVCAGGAGIAQIGLMKILGRSEVQNLISGLIVTALILVLYSTLYKFYERRAITELSTAGLGKNLFMGIVIGVALQSLTIFVIFLSGGFLMLSINSFTSILPAITMAFTAAISEEILIRGILFRHLEEKLGSYIALAISALIFGALHLANPNSSLVAGIGIALQAGVLLGAAFIYSKNLWFPIALHFAWNFTQSGIFGARTSGNETSKSFLTTKIEGSEIITGGEFGPEGSIQATLFCLIAAIALMALNVKQNKIVAPYWKNSIEGN